MFKWVRGGEGGGGGFGEVFAINNKHSKERQFFFLSIRLLLLDGYQEQKEY